MTKYKKGYRITDLGNFIFCLEEDELIYDRDKVQSAGWITSWSLRYILEGIKKGNFYKVEKLK